MAVRGIEYVELYTNDKQPVVDYFTAAMGFTQIAQAVDHDRESALLRPARGVGRTRHQ
jgi:4-hydroxyphenylpyruvate dioxygenase-like putative hemolysin